jgi:hypothetical protein
MSAIKVKCKESGKNGIPDHYFWYEPKTDPGWSYMESNPNDLDYVILTCDEYPSHEHKYYLFEFVKSTP